jgi:hypothetical protein
MKQKHSKASLSLNHGLMPLKNSGYSVFRSQIVFICSTLLSEETSMISFSNNSLLMLVTDRQGIFSAAGPELFDII